MAKIISTLPLRVFMRGKRKNRIIIGMERKSVTDDAVTVAIRDFERITPEPVQTPEGETITPQPYERPIPGTEQTKEIPAAVYGQIVAAAIQMIKAKHPGVTENSPKYDLLKEQYSLLIFVTSDFLKDPDTDEPTGDLIYDSKPNQWEIY